MIPKLVKRHKNLKSHVSTNRPMLIIARPNPQYAKSTMGKVIIFEVKNRDGRGVVTKAPQRKTDFLIALGQYKSNFFQPRNKMTLQTLKSILLNVRGESGPMSCGKVVNFSITVLERGRVVLLLLLTSTRCEM